MEDLYGILGVDHNASVDEIRRAYRRLARELHPDINPDSADRFKAVTHAYNILSDPEQRQRYDRHVSGGFSSDFNLSDLFQSFFDTSAEFQRGSDLLVNIDIDLKTAIYGGSQVVKIDSLVVCDVCNGTRSEPGYKAEVCFDCNGSGVVRGEVRTTLGNLITQNTCSKCRGNGERIDHPCRRCYGNGSRSAPRDITINIPPGVETGMRIKIPNMGNAGGAMPGDLYVDCKVKEHPYFLRDGQDLYCRLDISLVDALLGTKVKIDSLDGELIVVIPALSQNRDVIRIANKGAVTLRGGKGDLCIVLNVLLMQKLDPEHRALLKKIMPNPPKPKLAKRTSGFFSWLKNKFT